MEKRIPSLIISILLFCFLFPFSVTAQTAQTDPTLRIELWVPFDEDPSLGIAPEPDEAVWMPAVRALHQVTPFIFSGMIYGWEFSYTPSDKTRGIEEYFEVTPLGSVQLKDPRLTFHDSLLTDTKIITQAEYERTAHMMKNREHWQSSTTAKVSGKGYGSVHEGTSGMQKAVEDAIKNAVRTWAQSYTKNKPKEIAGSIVLSDKTPLIGVKNGQYVADLDFFLYVVTINQYQFY